MSQLKLKVTDSTSVAIPLMSDLDAYQPLISDLSTIRTNASEAAAVKHSHSNKETLDGITATAAEINVLDGITATTAELNILDGVTATAAEINVLDGITATTTELNYVDGVTSAIQTQLNAKQESFKVTFSPAETPYTGIVSDVSHSQVVSAVESGKFVYGVYEDEEEGDNWQFSLGGIDDTSACFYQVSPSSLGRYGGTHSIYALVLTSDSTTVNVYSGWELAETRLIAEEYSTSVSYAVGDYCHYCGELFRCTTATRGAWASSAWTAVTVGEELSAKEDTSNKVTVLNSSSTDTQYPSAKCVYTKLNTKEAVANKVTSISSSSTDTQYPSAKCVWDRYDDLSTQVVTNTGNIQTAFTNITSLQSTTSGHTTQIGAINGKIPTEASSSNQLADKAFVNSSISTETATFRGTSASGLTEEQFLAWANGLTHDKNDYVFWNTTDDAGNTIYKRYKYTGSAWAYEYSLNNSSFTAAQWAAINSGITSAAVHTHSNKSVLDTITSALVSAWTTAGNWVSTNGANVLSHIASTVVHITAAERTAWNAKSTVYVSSTEPTSWAVGDLWYAA